MSGQDLSLLFECCNYFGVKTSRWKFCVATVFGSKLAKPAPRRVLVLQLFSGRDPHPKKFAHATIFGSRPTSCRIFSFAIIFGSRPYDGVSCTRLLRSVVSASCRFEWLDLNALLRAASFVIVVVLLSSSFSSCRPCSWFLETESCNYFRVKTLQEFECQDYSRVKTFRIDWCCNYFGVKTSCRSLGVGTFLRSRPSYLFECCNYFGVNTSCRNFSFAILVDTLRRMFRVRISHGWIVEVGLLTCLHRSF